MDPRFAEFGPHEMHRLTQMIRALARYAHGCAPERSLDYHLDRCWDAVPGALASYQPGRGRSLLSWLGLKIRYALRQPREPLAVPFEQVPEPVAHSSVDAALVWQQVLAQASPGQRTLAHLLGQGYTTVEAADILGIAPMAAYQRVAALRRHLQVRGGMT